MRTIKFRGKRLNNGEWVYGSLTQSETHNKNGESFMVSYIAPFIPVGSECGFELVKMDRVTPTTVGQFTGMLDKNGKEIYEGDIISSKKHPQIKHLIFYNEEQGKFMAGLYGNTNIYDFGVCGVDNPSWMAEKEVVGDIHDNPELLKGGQDD